MIINFSLKNYLSIKNEISLSFLSNKNSDNPALKIISFENKYYLYPFTAIYGPNASGKSNIIKALMDMTNFILNSHRLDLDKTIPVYKPFKLEKENVTQPVYFDIEFIAEDIRYFYLIEFSKKEILKEELYFFPNGRKSILFLRSKDKDIKYGTYFTGEKKTIETFLLPNRLLVSVAANSKNDLLQPIFRYFRDKIHIHVRMDSSHYPVHSTTLELKDNKDEFKTELQKMLKAADLSIKDIKLEIDEKVSNKLIFADNTPDEIKNRITETLKYKPYLGHAIYNKGNPTNEIEFFSLIDEESTGTIKMYDISSEILNALKNGTVLIIDEFNSGLHPLLNKFLVKLFINPSSNPKNAQLLISTHDTCVLDMNVLKREQIWFTEKKDFGSTELFSLDEFDKNLIRDYSSYSKHYLDGRFGAVPSTDIAELIKGLF